MVTVPSIVRDDIVNCARRHMTYGAIAAWIADTHKIHLRPTEVSMIAQLRGVKRNGTETQDCIKNSIKQRMKTGAICKACDCVRSYVSQIRLRMGIRKRNRETVTGA